MPPRSTPTVRQMRLGAELRKLREGAGLPARAAAEMIGGNQAKISHVESGRWGVSAERVRRLAAFYFATDETLVDALCAMAEERGKGWWEEYRGVLPQSFLDLAELEHHATYFYSIQALTIPGIFQTEGYARSLFESVIPPLPESEIEARVEHRMRRRVIFERASPSPFDGIIHEAALRMCSGGRRVVKAQLEYLLEVSEWPTVTLRVIPFASEKFIGSAQNLLYAGGVIPSLDTATVDTAYGSAFLDVKAQLAKYRAIYHVLAGVSLGIRASRETIRDIAQEM
ncbi:MAG: helix-turn-helix domain-containing protein [Streptomyces sp.]|nr:helix-turn-helix domain-containing protein [Streptomyces sp.]